MTSDSLEDGLVSNEGMLMHTCGHLYLSIALEAFSTTVMSLIFTYLLLLVTNRGRLRNPGRAAAAFLGSHISDFVKDVYMEVSRWRDMQGMPLEKRFSMCRKANQAMCVFQILIGMLTIERWLHINNVNGFRYLGYAVTCPPMHTELVVLIAPVVPCYKWQCYFTYFVTTAMLLCAYAASLIQGDLYSGNMSKFLETLDVSNDLQLTRKGCAVLTGGSILSYLTFVQIPYLCIMYNVGGGVKGNLPHGYRKLLLIVAVTWLAFPVWWSLSYEGLNIISDTKMNAVGFAILNIISKGSFTLQMLAMSRWHREERKKQKYRQNGRQPSKIKEKSLFNTGGLFDPGQSSASLQFTHTPSFEARRRDSMVMEMLRPFDEASRTDGESWLSLEFDYRAFLVGQGVTANSWKVMEESQRNQFHEMYQERYDLVSGERAEASTVLSKVEPPQAAAGGRHTIHEEAEEEDHEQGGMHKSEETVVSVCSQSLKVKDTPEPCQHVPLSTDLRLELGMHLQDAAKQPFTPPEPMRLDAPQKAACPPHATEARTKGLRVAQVVTTKQGLKGRVAKVGEKVIEISVQGKRTEEISISELAVVKVAFLAARGLRMADPSCKLDLYCSALIERVPSTEVRTEAKAPGKTRETWDDVAEVYGFTPGSSVALRLWGTDPGGRSDDVLLGEAVINEEAFIGGDYEDEVQLTVDGQGKQVYLTVMINAVNLPKAPPVDFRKIDSRRADSKVIEDHAQPHQLARRATTMETLGDAAMHRSFWCSCPSPG